MGATSDPLFDEPERVIPELSAMYSAPRYRRAGNDGPPRYVEIRAGNSIPCDECFANQHESRGASGPRGSAKVRRSFLGGPKLNLCRAHAHLWRERDEKEKPNG